MLFRRFCLCLLAFAFICAVLFSHSVSVSAASNFQKVNMVWYLKDKVYNEDGVVKSYIFNYMFDEHQPYTEFYYSYQGSSWIFDSATHDKFIYIPTNIVQQETLNDKFKFSSYLFGYNGNFYAVDVSDFKSGSGFQISFNWGFDWCSDFLGENDVCKFKAIWLDDDFNRVGVSSSDIPYTENGFVSGEDWYTISTSFTVPDGAEYFYLLFESNTFYNEDYGNLLTSNEIYFTVYDIEMSCDISAFEENSETMNQIKETLDESLEEEKKQTGFLEGILDGILNLPKKIVDGLVDAIKNLFVPSEEDMVAMKDEWEELLSDRFGAVYESTSIIDDWANAFTAGDTQETIDIPTVTVNLAGTPFSFGGWEVDIIPDGFEGLIDTLKLIVNIACTFLFVNGMKKRLDGVLS